MVVNSWYNGYSPKERDDKYKAMNRLIMSGQLPHASRPCDLCNDPNVPVEYHDEITDTHIFGLSPPYISFAGIVTDTNFISVLKILQTGIFF